MAGKSFILTYNAHILLVMLLMCGFFSQAQTFMGQPKLTPLPASFDAKVYPSITQPTTIRVVFNNPMGGEVRVLIQNAEGQLFYDAYESIRQYRRRFDLATLSEGSYTIVLSKQNSRYTQAFVIDPPVRPKNKVTLVTPPDTRSSGKAVIVSPY